MLLNESIATCLKVQTMTHFHFEIQFFTAATPEGKKRMKISLASLSHMPFDIGK